MPAYFLSCILLAAMPFLERQGRIILLVPAAILFAVGYARSERRGLQILVFLTGLPMFLSVGGADVGVAGTFLTGAAYLVALSKRKLRWNMAVAVPAVLLLAIYSFGTLQLEGTVFFNSSARLFVGLVAAVALAQLIYGHVADGGDAAPIVRAIGVTLIVEAAFVLLQRYGIGAGFPLLEAFSPRNVVLGASTVEGFSRGNGAIGDYELVSEWFAIGVPLFLGFAVRSRDRLLSIFVLLACVAGLVGTVTRGGLVAAAAGVVVLLLLSMWGGTRRTLEFAFLGLGAVMLAGLTAVLALPAATSDLEARIGEIAPAPGAVATFSDLAALLNRDVWVTHAGLLKPTLLGNGLYRMDLLGLAGPSSLHSLPLSVWYQVGFAGSVLAAFVLLATVVLSFPRRIAARTDHAGFILQAALVSGLAAMLVNEFKVEFLRYEYTTAFAIAYLGLTLGHNVELRREAVEEEGPPLPAEGAGPDGPVEPLVEGLGDGPAATVAARALERALAVAGTYTGSVMLLAPDSATMRIVAARGLSDRVVESTRVSESEGIAGLVLQTGNPMFVEDLPGLAAGGPPERRRLHSGLSVPIADEEGIFGVLNVGARGALARLTEDHIEPLSEIARDLARALRERGETNVPMPDGASREGTS